MTHSFETQISLLQKLMSESTGEERAILNDAANSLVYLKWEESLKLKDSLIDTLKLQNVILTKQLEALRKTISELK